MTPKLSDRLLRLEASQVTQANSGELSPDLVQVWLRAIAIRLGGFPMQSDEARLHSDTFSDGFARGLGYRDRDDMEARSINAPADWQQRMERAHAALCERYEADDYSSPQDRSFKLMVAALNEWSGAKAGNPDWPDHDDSDRLVSALALHGVQAETAEMRGCR